MAIAERLQRVRQQIAAACAACGRDPAEVDLLPVSKRHPIETIEAARAAGVVAFGENRVQELIKKAADPRLDGIFWHLIGSLQTNKCNQVVRLPGLAMIQTVDRHKLADALQVAAFAEGKTIDVLVQVDATGDAGKHGARPDQVPALVCHLLDACPNLPVVGLMAMGPRTGDPAPVFAAVSRLRAVLRDATGLFLPTLSMGMTGDMPDAIAAGSTMVRVGTGVFGERPPT